jgi:hypothetical protein
MEKPRKFDWAAFLFGIKRGEVFALAQAPFNG